MKTEILKREIKGHSGIDWNKPQLVKAKTSDLLVLAISHTGDNFSGVVIFNDLGYKAGHFDTLWCKNKFEEVVDDITIKFIS